MDGGSSRSRNVLSYSLGIHKATILALVACASPEASLPGLSMAPARRSSPGLCFHAPLMALPVRTSVRLGAPLMTLFTIISLQARLHVQSHSEVLGVRT